MKQERVLSLGLDVWQSRWPETLPMDWRAYWAAARADPWNGVSLWLMAATTLLPTFLHAALGIGAVVTYGFHIRAEALRRLTAAQAQRAMTDAERLAIARGLVRARLYEWVIGLSLAALICWALWALFAIIAPHMPNGVTDLLPS